MAAGFINCIETITFRGKTLKHVNLKWGQAFNAGLPDSVALTAGDSTWNGSVDIFPGDGDLLSGGASPYAYGLPIPGDILTISITADDEGYTFKAMVDTATYNPDRVTYKLVQPTIDNFTKNRLRLPPVFGRSMPTTSQWGSQQNYGHRFPAPTAFWHVAEAMRESGFHNTPPRDGSNTKIDMTCQGIFWCNTWRGHGEVLAMASKSGADDSPTLASDGTRTYMTDGTFTVVASDEYTFSRAGAARVSCIVPTSSTGDLNVTLNAGFANQQIYFTVTKEHNAFIYQGIDGTVSQIGYMALGDAELISFCVVDRKWEFATELGKTSGNTAFSGAFTGLTGSVDTGGRIAGIQVDDVTSMGHRILGWTANFKMATSTLMRVQPCLPSLRDAVPRDVLDELAGKLLSSWWVDTLGVAHFEAAQAFISKPVTHTLTALEHIGDYSFTDDIATRRSGVRVKFSDVALSRSQMWRVNVWQGGGTGEAGDSSETFVGPEDGKEEWGDVDWTLNRVTSDIDGFNTRNGSWYTATKDNPDDTSKSVFNVGYGGHFERITPWLSKYVDLFDVGGSKKTPAEDTRLRGDLRDMDMPVLRARAKAVFEDRYFQIERGPAGYPILELDCTRYLQYEEFAQQTATLLADMLADPKPQHQLTVRYNPMLELGEVIRVKGVMEDGTGNLYSAILKCLIISYTHSPEDGTTSLECRVTVEERTLKTWARVEADVTAKGMSWESLEATRTTNKTTWADVEADPNSYTGA